jgi:hypothetical protein
VRADNPIAQALYASEGFGELGRRPRYYQPDDVDAVVMRLDLGAWAGAGGETPQVSGSAAGNEAHQVRRHAHPWSSAGGSHEGGMCS